MEAAFDGDAITSDAGALLLREKERAIGLIDRFGACFLDGRHPARVVHALRTLIGQRIIGLALGYEDVNDEDRPAGTPVPGLPVPHPEQLEPAPEAHRKAEHLAKGANPRFIVTSLKRKVIDAKIPMKRSTAPAARWRTGSKSSNSTS